MLLLLDIGNTHTHLGLAPAPPGGPNDTRPPSRQPHPPAFNTEPSTFATPLSISHQHLADTSGWRDGSTQEAVQTFIAAHPITGACFCSVVPNASPFCHDFLRARGIQPLELNAATLRGVGIDYPAPETIGADRLANAIAVKAHYGAPSLVVDFGTAVTFDVVDRAGNYVGGIIAPGLSAMTDYLHEKTALLPKISIREPEAVIGRNTEEAMLIGAVHGYRGLIRGLIYELRIELEKIDLPVVATGGYAELIARNVREITAVQPNLTLEGLRLAWQNFHASS